MNQDSYTDELQLLTNGLPRDVFEKMTDPSQDPALTLPSYATEPAVRHEPADDVPSVDQVETALLAHVRGEAAPYDLITQLFEPFTSYADLRPGKGQKRPSYALELNNFGVTIPRAPVREVAQQLQEIASDISCYRVGKRAPKDAPEMDLLFQYDYPYTFSIKAPTADAARLAYHALTGRRVPDVQIKLPYKRENLPAHILAARELAEAATIGDHENRTKALRLLRAAQDIRAAATTILRRNPEISKYATYHIEIALGVHTAVTISNHETQDMSAHEEVEFASKHLSLKQTLLAVIKKHTIIAELPKNWSLRLTGEPHYLDFSLIGICLNTGKTNFRASSQIFEYNRLNELSDLLKRDRVTPYIEAESEWTLNIGYGARSKNTWNLIGKTLTHAIVGDLDLTDDRASMTLTDLLIDIYAGKSPDEISLMRILRS